MTQVFTISDGTTTLNLLAAPYELANYETGINQWKDGGIFADSSLTEGNIPVFRQFDSFEETLTIHITGSTQDSVIASTRALLALLDSGVEYFVSNLGTQCYMSVRGTTETNTRYAVITAYRMESLPAQLGGAFVQGAVTGSGTVVSAYTGIQLVLRRGIWLENVPGTLVSVHDASVTLNHTASFVDIPATLLAGDVDPIIRMRIASIPSNYNKVIIGRRTYSRGNNFNAYLNFSDVGADLPSGVSIENDGSVTWVADADSPTGRAARQAAPQLGVGINNGVWIQLDSTLAGEYIGKYRAFVMLEVGTEAAWTSGQFIVRLSVGTVTASSLVTSYVDYPEVEMNSGTSTPEILDFGVIEIPTSLPRSGTVQNTILSVSITDTAVSKVNTIKLMQIIIIPADESIVDLDLWRPDTSAGSGYHLTLDKLVSPEETMDVKLELASSSGTTSRPTSSGAEALYGARTRHRFWIYNYVRDVTIVAPTGILFNVFNAPASHNIKVYKLNRYLLPRGAT